MKLENPWIAAECQQHAIRPNGLSTYLQEQYGQLGEDLILEAVLRSLLVRAHRPPSTLRYLEVGANHPIQTSNTYLFYRKWHARGVLVEANPRLIDALSQVRADDVVLNVAVTPAGHGAEAELMIAQHSELSSIDPGHVASFGANGRIAEKVRVPTVSLDTLIGHHFTGGLDLLSIDIEGLDLQVLREAALPVRPACIVAEPSRHYQTDAEKQFAAVLDAKGYLEVARTEYNLIYVDRAQFPATSTAVHQARTVLRTFDIFDTLIARHCVRADAVFEAVEESCRMPGFKAARLKAERTVETSEYSIVDIYREVKTILALTDEQAEDLLAAELREELANVVPIAENIARLTPDSVLVTDMYLPPDIIRALLVAGGVTAELPVVQTSHGKRNGSIWRSFSGAGYECHHLGDNRQSDHDTALAAGMQAELHSMACPTALEQRLIDHGFVELPRAIRSARLMTRMDGVSSDLRRLQTELNIPFLVVCAILIRQHSLAQGLDRILFAARDALHLKLVYDALCGALGNTPTSIYWHTSRLARTAGDPQYLDYCRSLLSPRSLVVDLCGTGASLLRLYRDLDLDGAPPQTLLCQQLNDAALANAFAQDYQLPADSALQTLHVVDGGFCPNEDLEILNYVPHGMSTAVTRFGAEWMPVRAAYEFGDALRGRVEEQHRILVEAARNLGKVFTPAAAREVETRGAEVIDALRASALALEPQRRAVRAHFLDAHRAFEAQTRQALKRGRTR